MRALDRKLYRTLWQIKGQVFAVAVVVACGVAVFIMALTALRALQDSRDAFYDAGRFADVFAHLKRAPDAVARRIAEIPGVQVAETRILADAALDVPGLEEPAIGRMVSLPPAGRPILNEVIVRRGRLPAAGSGDEVAVAEAFARAHAFSIGDRVSAILNGRKRTLTVVGIVLSPEYVYSVAPGMLMPDDRRFGVLWMDEKALAAAFDLDGAFNDILLRLRRDAAAAEVIARLDQIIEPFGGRGAYARKDQISHALLTGELDQLRALSRMIPPVFLGIAAFLLYVMVSRLVTVERQQIGLLKACGYRNGAIATHYLELTLAVLLVGIAGGIAGGLWLGRELTEIYGRFYHFPALYYRPVPWVIATASAIAVMAGAAAALAATARVARLPPATAMQPAAPPVYNDILPGLLGRLTQPSRIVIRNILRWPLRSSLTTLGIALAVATIVSSSFGFDAVERMIQISFFTAQRFDVMLTYVEPKTGAVANEVARLPGVQAVEPFRAVAVRLRHGHRAELSQITGLREDGALRRIVTADFRAVPPPRHGLLVSPKLAENLGVVPGDDVSVEIMEGRRRTLSLPIAGVVEEYLGTPAYMEIEALGRAIGEPGQVSGSFLRIDPLAEPALFARLKEIPNVATVAVKAATVRSFRDTMAESMSIMLTFYIAFGGVIGLGVLYNSARIALSERARELATLRVLGFTRFEVSYILLGELALLTIAALPLGCVLGYGWAWGIVQAFESDMFVIPLVIERATYGTAIATVLAAAVLAGFLVRRNVDRLDMVGVLKTME
ncbi:MAG: FtsX-like permease family protein [Rhodospirillales bacterium]|nr:FtsX-like permease family protein [Rhodospirillales bacterium]